MTQASVFPASAALLAILRRGEGDEVYADQASLAQFSTLLSEALAAPNPWPVLKQVLNGVGYLYETFGVCDPVRQIYAVLDEVLAPYEARLEGLADAASPDRIGDARRRFDKLLGGQPPGTTSAPGDPSIVVPPRNIKG